MIDGSGYTLRDVNDWFDGQNLSAERVLASAAR